jgi:hypothetical protein
MTVTNALASIAVSDLSTSTDWYGTFLGRGNQPMPEVVEWQFERGGGLQIYAAPERSGGSSCTLVVDNIDEIARRLRGLGIDDVAPATNDRVDTVMVKDPDGNSIAFAMPKDPRLAQ